MSGVPSRHLWVGGLPEEIGETGIKELFSKYGKIEGVKILPQRYPNLGVAAFIDFYDVRSAIDAKEAKIVFQGCELRTNFKAKPTEKFEHPTRKDAPASAKRQESPEKETKDKEKTRGNESSSSSSSESGSSSDSSSSNDSSSESERGKKTKKKSKGDVDTLFLKVSNLASRPERVLQDGLYYEFTRYSSNAVIRMYGDGMDVWAVVKFDSKENCKKAYVEAQGLVLFGSKMKLTPIAREDFPVGGRDIQVVPPGPASGGVPPMAHIGGVPMPKPFPAEDIDPQATRSLFVGNIPKNISVYELRDIFQRFGDVLDVEIKKMSGNATYGFVLFYDLLSAVSAKQFMDGENIRGNNIRVGFGKGTPSKMLWVDGVDPNMLESTLERTMSKYGKVVRLGIDRQRCSAMVQFDSMEAAKDALNGIKGTFIGNSRRIMTDYANRDARAAFFSRMESGEPVGPPRFPGPGMYGPAGMGPGPRGMMMPRPGMPMMGMSRGGFPPMHGPPIDLYYYNPFMGEGMGFYGQPPFPGGPPMRGMRRFSHGHGPYEDSYDDYGDELRAFTRKREKEKEEKKRKERRRKHSSSEESGESDSGDSTSRRKKKASKDKDKQKKAKKEKSKDEKGSKDPESDASSDGEMSKKEEARLRATQRSRDLREKLKKRGRKKEKEGASSNGEALTDESDSEKEVEPKKSSKRLKEKKDQEKDKDRDREKDREREREKEKGRDREREKEKERDRAKEREREKEEKEEKDRERDREKEKERDKNREKDRERDKEKERDTEKEKEREKARERVKGRDKDTERERGREKEREDREKIKDRDKERERAKVKEKERDRRKDKEREEGRDSGRGRDKQRDRGKPPKDELKERERDEKDSVRSKSPKSPAVPVQEEMSEPPKITFPPRTPPSPKSVQVVGDTVEPEQPRAQVKDKQASPAMQHVPSSGDKGGEDMERQGVPETPESPPHKRTLQQKLESDLSSGEEFPDQVLASPSLPQEEDEGKEKENLERKSSKEEEITRSRKELSPQPQTPPTEPSSVVPSPPTVSSSPVAAVQHSPHFSEEESEERGNGMDGSRKSKKLPRCYQIEDEKQKERQREVREHRHPSKPHPPTTPSPPPAYVGHRRRPLHSPPPPEYNERRWRHRGRPFSPGQFMPPRYSRSPPPGYPPSPPSHGGGRSPYSGSPPPRPRTPIQRPRDRGGPRHRYESPPYDNSRAKHPRRGSSPARHPSPSPPPRPRSPGRRHPRRYSRSPSPARRSPLRRKERSLSPGSSRSSPRHVEDRLESRKHGKKPQVYSRSPSPKPKRREGPREDYPDPKRRRVDETRPKSPPSIPPLPKEEPKLLRPDKSQPPSYQSPVASFSSAERHPPHHTGKESSRYPPQPQQATTHPSVPARSHYTQPSPKHAPMPVPAPVATAIPQPQQQQQQQQQQPPQQQPPTDNLMDLLRRYPVMWQGHLTLKNDSAAVQLHFLSGNVNLAKMSLPQTVEGRTPALRIAQRMRLEQTQLEGVERRMQSETEHCLLLALPCGRDANDVRTQTHALKNSLISYLLQKQAAGIINVPGSQTGFVLHIFPPCSFSQAHLSRVAPDLLSSASDNCHLMIIVATM